MDEFTVLLLVAVVLPVLLVGSLVRWFWRLSKPTANASGNQLATGRMLGLLAIACVTCLVVYGWLDIVTQPMGTAHGPSTTTPRQHHYDTLWWVLLLGMSFGLLLVRQPSRRRAARSFGAGLLLALSSTGGGWRLYFAHEERVLQTQRADYALVQPNDSLQHLPNGFYGRKAGGSATAPRSTEEIPTFPGGEPALRQAIQKRINYQAVIHRQPLAAAVEVDFIVETDGRITGAHVSEHHNLVCDAEAIRVINSLPRFRPGLQNGRPIAAIWHISVPFQQHGAPKL